MLKRERFKQNKKRQKHGTEGQVNGMSDDLISRKVLLGTERLLMTDIVENNPTAKYILEQVLFDIENAPTAFDKEKVTSKLKEKYNYSQKVYVELSLHPEHDDSCLAYWDGMVDAYKEAIEIIEKGGIE